MWFLGLAVLMLTFRPAVVNAKGAVHSCSMFPLLKAAIHAAVDVSPNDAIRQKKLLSGIADELYGGSWAAIIILDPNYLSTMVYLDLPIAMIDGESAYCAYVYQDWQYILYMSYGTGNFIRAEKETDGELAEAVNRMTDRMKQKSTRGVQAKQSSSHSEEEEDLQAEAEEHSRLSKRAFYGATSRARPLSAGQNEANDSLLRIGQKMKQASRQQNSEREGEEEEIQADNDYVIHNTTWSESSS